MLMKPSIARCLLSSAAIPSSDGEIVRASRAENDPRSSNSTITSALDRVSPAHCDTLAQEGWQRKSSPASRPSTTGSHHNRVHPVFSLKQGFCRSSEVEFEFYLLQALQPHWLGIRGETISKVTHRTSDEVPCRHASPRIGFLTGDLQQRPIFMVGSPSRFLAVNRHPSH